MQYMGGKQLISTRISEIINHEISGMGGETFVSLCGLIKKMAGLQNATFISMDYKEVIIPNGSVVYADPPYANTTAYGSKFKIDYDDFWDYMREISKNNIVFISEEHAPDDFECVWQKEVVRTLDKNLQNRPKKIEKLFKYRNA